MGVFSRERSGMKVDIVAIEKVLGYMRWLVWVTGVFGISCHIDAPKSYLPAMSISKIAIFDGESQ